MDVQKQAKSVSDPIKRDGYKFDQWHRRATQLFYYQRIVRRSRVTYRSQLFLLCFFSLPFFFISYSLLCSKDGICHNFSVDTSLHCVWIIVQGELGWGYFSKGGRSHFFPAGSVFGQNRENRCSRSQACDPGPRERRRSLLGIGMETAEGSDGTSGPSGLAPGLGCASFNQDST